MLWIELKSDALRKVSKVRTGGSHFLFNDATLKYNSVSDRSGNPATQHVLNAKTGIYAKLEMLRCRLKRRARLCGRSSERFRRGTPLTSNPYFLTPRSAYQWDYGQGITPDMQPYNLNSFIGKWGGTLGNDSFQSLPQRANAHMNSILFPAPETRGYRYGSGSSAGTYDQAYGQALVNQTMVQVFFLNQLDLVCMGFCMLTMAYVNEINTYNSNRNQVNDAVSQIGAQGAALKGLYSQLQELTDVDDTNQLLSVLGKPEFGLSAQDLAMIQKTNPGSNSLKDIVWKTSPTATNPLSFNDLVGSDGLRLAQQKAIHDQYGNYVRSGEYTAGGTTASAEKTDQYGRQTALMVGADEFLDAMGVLAEAQYQVARDAYYSKAENYTKQIGTGNEDKIAVKVDAKVVLQEREKFASDLLKKITRTTNGETIAYNVETNIYRTVLNDYMGETGVVSQIFNAELQQRAQQQKQQWDMKEQEFYDLKSDWIQNVSYLKQTGTKRWENMVQEFQGKWKDWRADFKAEHEANQKIYLDRIESTLEKKEAWTTSFLQKSSEQADELTMKEMYDSIAGMVTSMQENLPAGVSMNVNVNDILSSILSKKPGSISASLIDRASSIDTNFFLNEVKKYNFNDSGLKEQFKGLLNETNKLSQNLIILQTLESLRSLPDAFAKTIKEQNESVEEQLNQTMAYDGFARLGGAYVRTIKTASGGDEVQTLGTYQYYNYNPPTVFPEVKDSKGKSWDLGKPEMLIDHDNVPSASDLTVMVRLAKNKMSADFKKVFNPEKQHNYEAEKGLFDPTEVQNAYNEYLEGVRNGETVSCLGKSAEQCAQSAMSSGFLVGEVADGSFGEAQFAQFYIILKTKKEMDKRKGKMDAARKRKQGGMGRLYNQLGAMGEGIGEAVKGAGSAIISGVKAYLKAGYTGDFNGAKKDLKEAGKQGERALQGALYAASGAIDFAMFVSETALEPFVTVLTLGMGTDAMNGTFAEGNYELAKFRDTNKAQRHLNELGMRTGAEMYANDAVVDKVVTTTLAAVGIIGAVLSFTPAAPVGVALLAVSALGTAGWKTFRGAYEGGAAGMLAGAVSGVVNSVLDAETNGMISVNLSYSYANGFGAGVSVGTDNKTELGGSIGLNYNSKSGAWGASVGLKVGLGQQTKDGYSNWAEVGYNRNNIGRDNQSSGVSANIRGQYDEKNGLNGSLGLSYDTKAGYGATIGLTSMFNSGVSITPSWTVSEYGGLSSDVQYGFSKNLLGNIFEQATNPNHASANRNLLKDIFNGFGAALSGLNGENLANGWNGIKNALFGGGNDGGDGNAATVKPGPRPGTYVDEDGTILVRDPKTGNLTPEWLVPNLQNAGSLSPNYPSHENVTEHAARNAGFSEAEIKILNQGVRSVDMPDGYFGLGIMWIKEKLGINPMTSNDPSLRTHYGPESFYHNQEPEPGVAPQVTKEKILSRIEELITLAREYESNKSRLPTDESRKISVGLLGMALHTIQDSFSEAHVVRDRTQGGYGEIVQFQIYTGQDHHAHNMSDLYTPNTFAYSASVLASQAVLEMYTMGKSVSDIMKYVDNNFYKISKDPKVSGVADDYKIY
ncbi:hypothetical protein LEP1GSC038_3395 [Leptospira weilii str. 2006001855]|uniref:TIGR04388 family protein n=1 Tax=Leptospira weilii str. 2006001855 TaxID=996804 RepID=M6FU29_9LEPT|nr:hypothetical protein LEP1GSC038_3395 [Leptospira weilii str. 2006001855]